MHFALLYCVMLISAIGNTAMMSVFPAVGRESGIPDALIGSVQSVSGLLSTITIGYWAGLSDRIGRKPIILMGSAGFVISMVLTGGAILLAIWHVVAMMLGYASILAARTIFGIFGLAAGPAVQAYVADRTERTERTGALAAMASAQGVGSILGPGLAPFLILPGLSLGAPTIVFGLIGAVVLVAVWRVLPADQERPRAARVREKRAGLWREPRVFPLFLYTIGMGACMMASTQMIGFVVIDTLHLPPLAAQPYAGAAMMAGAAMTVLTQLVFIPRFRLTPLTLLHWGAGFAIAGNLALIFASNIFAIAACFAVLSLGYAMTRAGSVAGLSLAAPPERQGEAAGLLFVGIGLGLGIAPFLGLALYGWMRPAPFLACAALMAVLAAMTATHAGMRRTLRSAET